MNELGKATLNVLGFVALIFIVYWGGVRFILGFFLTATYIFWLFGQRNPALRWVLDLIMRDKVDIGEFFEDEKENKKEESKEENWQKFNQDSIN